jgi:uncharacterized protein (TIGR00251 family)
VKVSITVKPNSKKREVEPTGPNELLVKVIALPRENKANKEVIETLAEYFDVPKSRVSILSGLRSKKKVLEVEEK